MSSERTPIYTSRLVFLAVARCARVGSEALRARSPSGVRSSLKPTDLPLTFLPAARTLQTDRNARTNHCGKARCSPLNRLAKQRVSFCRNRRFCMRLCMGYQFCVAVPKIVISAALCLEFPPPRPAVLFRSLAPLFPWFLLPFRTRKT